MGGGGLEGERGAADRRLGRCGIEAMPERIVLLVEIGDSGPRSERIVRVNCGSLSVRGDVRDEGVEFVEPSGGVVRVPLGDAVGDPRLVCGDRVVGEVLDAPLDLVG
jgi:hypothetical protein